jgi:Flp pilus assembly protein TadB
MDAKARKDRERFEELSRKLDEREKKANPVLSALAAVCLIVVVVLLVANYWTLAIPVALIGLVFGYYSRK